MKNLKIDFRLLKNYGLSLNTNKKYFVIYEPFCWTLIGVYDNIEDALDNCWFKSTLDQYYEICANSNSKFDKNYIGENHEFCKGFFQNIDVWLLLSMLSHDTKDVLSHDLNGSDSTEEISYVIDSKLKSIYMKE